MKKIFFTLSFLLSLSCFSQDTDSKTPILDKTEKLVDKYSAKVAKVFISTLETAKPVAKEGFRAIVLYQVAKGIGYLIPIFLFFLFLILCRLEYKRILKLLSSENPPAYLHIEYSPFDERNISSYAVCTFICTVICAVLALFCTYNGIIHIIGAKWFAIKEIIEVIK